MDNVKVKDIEKYSKNNGNIYNSYSELKRNFKKPKLNQELGYYKLSSMLRRRW